MTTRRSVLVAIMAIAAIGLGPAAAATSGAVEFIRTTGEKALRSLTDKGLSDAERAKRFREQLIDAFDLPTIGRFVLGRYWGVATEAQRSEYLALFEDFLVQTYSVHFRGLEGKLFVERALDIDAGDVLVMSEVQLTKGTPYRIDWRVRGPKLGKFRIVDVMFEGVSMSVTQRAEFAAVIRRRGGKVEGLLAALRQKTGKSG